MTEVVDGEAPISGEFANDGGFNVPFVDDLEEALLILGSDDRHHAFLGFGHEDLTGGEARVAQKDLLEVNVHP